MKRTIACLIVVLAATAVFSQEAADEREAPDAICKALFDEYIVRARKVPGDDITAAIQLIASRGRTTGFWRIVFAELQADSDQSEVPCVRILGRMLEVDALARETIARERETGEVGQWGATVELDEEVVDVLLARADAADRFRLPHYLVALARSRDPRVTGLFHKVLQGKHEKDPTEGALFHAAVGLAEQRDPAGIEWLIAHVENNLPTVSAARPSGAASDNLSACCLAALRTLSGERKLETEIEWRAWWHDAKATYKPAAHVHYVD